MKALCDSCGKEVEGRYTVMYEHDPILVCLDCFKQVQGYERDANQKPWFGLRPGEGEHDRG